MERLRYQRTNSIICGEAANEIEKLRRQNESLLAEIRVENRVNRLLSLYEAAMMEIARLKAVCGLDQEEKWPAEGREE